MSMNKQMLYKIINCKDNLLQRFKPPSFPRLRVRRVETAAAHMLLGTIVTRRCYQQRSCCTVRRASQSALDRLRNKNTQFCLTAS